jgi:hypothetical protein
MRASIGGTDQFRRAAAPLPRPGRREGLKRDAKLRLSGVREAVAGADGIVARAEDTEVELVIDLSPGGREMLAAGGLVNWLRAGEARPSG